MVDMSQQEVIDLFEDNPTPDPDTGEGEQTTEGEIKPEVKVEETPPVDPNAELKSEVAQLRETLRGMLTPQPIQSEEDEQPITRAALKGMLLEQGIMQEVNRLKETDKNVDAMGPDVHAYIQEHPEIRLMNDSSKIVKMVYEGAKKRFATRMGESGYIKLDEEGLSVLEARLMERQKKRSSAAQASAKAGGTVKGKVEETTDADDVINEMLAAKPKYFIE